MSQPETPGQTRRELLKRIKSGIEAAAVVSGVAAINVPKLRTVSAQEASPKRSIFLTAPERIPVEVFAGGEFADPLFFQDRIFWNSGSGAYVGLSLRMYKFIHGELVQAGIDNPTSEDIGNRVTRSIADGESSSLFSVLLPGSCLLLDTSGAYALRPERTTGRISASVLTSGQEEKVAYPDAAFYKPHVIWSDKHGLVATDGLRITDKFDKDAGQFVQLTTPELAGLPNQVVGKKLRELQEMGVVDPAEVTAFETSPQLSGYKTFRILPNTRGEPTIVLLTSDSEYGLATDFGLVDAIVQACRRLNEIDPENNKLSLEYLNRQYNLWVIGGDTPPETFITNPGWGASFNASRGIIKLNPARPEVLRGNELVAAMMATILLESRHIYNYQHFFWNGKTHELLSSDMKHSDGGLDKALHVIELTERSQSRLTGTEYRMIRWYAEATYDLYTQRLAMQANN